MNSYHVKNIVMCALPGTPVEVAQRIGFSVSRTRHILYGLRDEGAVVVYGNTRGGNNVPAQRWAVVGRVPEFSPAGVGPRTIWRGPHPYA